MNNECHHNKSRSNLQGESCTIVETVHFPSIDSTNKWAKEYCSRWPDKGVFCVTASEQTAGRGRWNRSWQSPSGVNIYASFCFWFDSERKDVGNLPQIMALAAVKTIEELNLYPVIKWPNDLLLSGKKVGGILCETVIKEGRLGVICGIGLNVNMALIDLNAIDRPATSLFAEAGTQYDLQEVFNLFKSNFALDLNRFFNEGFSPFYQRFIDKSVFKKGDTLSFHHGGERIFGTWNRLTEDGAVELTLLDGSKKIFFSAEFLES